MTSVPLEVSVAEFAKAIDDIFEQQLKLLNEIRESFRLITTVLQKNSHDKVLPPLEEIGVNKKYFNSEATYSDTRKNKPVEQAWTVPKQDF